ncbi:MAG: hypothetical protein Q9166_003125 [cf. Caloplaca sp. 2 TL-2023]
MQFLAIEAVTAIWLFSGLDSAFNLASAMDPSDQLQRLGQQEYQRKNYHTALNFFNSVISQEKEPGITVYDCRAATYEKLDDLHTALKDGRCMISNVGRLMFLKGYLRTGKILQLLDKDTVALGIYEYGLRNIPISDPKFQLLREMYETMNLKCRPRNAKDPLTLLPAEVAELIISNLDFKHIVSLTRVSRSWRDFLKSSPSLWTSLDFSKAKKNVPKTAIQRYIRFSRGRVTKLVMNRFTTQQPSNLYDIMSFCKELHHLEFGSGYINTSLIKAVSIAKNLKCLLLSERCETSLDCIGQILGKCPHLVRAEFHYVKVNALARPQWQGDMSQLRILTMIGVKDDELSVGAEPLFHPLIEMISEIRELSLRLFATTITAIPTSNNAMTHLEKLKLQNVWGDINFVALPSLRVLELQNCEVVVNHFSKEGPTPDLRVDGMVEFSIADDDALDMHTLLRLLGPKPSALRNLHIVQCIEITRMDLSRLIELGYMDQVVDLDLTRQDVTDTVIEALAARAHQLKRIKLAMTNITGVGVKALVTKANSQLQHLDISDCMYISADAVALARFQRGLTVESRRTESRGRKVRSI